MLFTKNGCCNYYFFILEEIVIFYLKKPLCVEEKRKVKSITEA